MKDNFSSNYFAKNVDTHATLNASTMRETSSVQVGPKFCQLAFLVDISVIADTLTVQLQNSINNVDWTDEPSANIGNDVTKVLDTTGTHVFAVSNPRAEANYVRLKCTASAGGAVIFGVILAGGPLRHISV